VFAERPRVHAEVLATRPKRVRDDGCSEDAIQDGAIASSRWRKPHAYKKIQLVMAREIVAGGV
jgi:hypothetical protein